MCRAAFTVKRHGKIEWSFRSLRAEVTYWPK
jgi:hypothetical protein